MNTSEQEFLKLLLSNLHVKILSADFVHVGKWWHEIDIIPDHNKLIYIIDGEGYIKINNQKYFPLSGQIYLIPEKVLQSYETFNTNAFKLYWCSFSATVGNKNLFDIIETSDFLQVHNKYLIESLFTNLIEYKNSNDLTSGLTLKSVLLEIICYFIDNSDEKNLKIKKTNETKCIIRSIEYMKKNISKLDNLDILLKELNLISDVLQKLYNDVLGVTPTEILNSIKIEKSKELLRNTSSSIAEIAKNIGIHTAFDFSHVFKKYTGYSPTEYRKNIL